MDEKASSPIRRLFLVIGGLGVLSIICFGAYFRPSSEMSLFQKTDYSARVYQVSSVAAVQTHATAAAPRVRPPISGYVSFPGMKPYHHRWRSCAYVTGSGHLSRSGLGKEIDGHDCVVRSNDSPTAGYEKDVGSKTTMRTVDFRALGFIKRRLETERTSFDKGVKHETLVVVYEYLKKMNNTESLIKEFLRRWPAMKFFILTEPRFHEIQEEFASRVAELKDEIWISNGFSTIMFLHDICDEIHAYGIADGEYCQRLDNNVPGTRATRYYYYGNSEMECDLFKRHSKAATWAHRFLKEKKLFGEWAKEWGNLHFHAPEWPDQ